MTTPAPQTPTAAQPQTENASENPSPASATPRIGSLYVADLAPTVTESNLYEFFRTIGPNAIASIRVCRDSQSQKSLGYAYVNFHHMEDADKAIDLLNYEPIDGKPCRISWSRRDPSLRKSGVGNVFIKNLATDIDHLGLYDTFSNFGEILSCKVATDETGQSKGYGFVHFATPEEADKAIDALNGKCLNQKQVYVGHFIPKHLRESKSEEENFTNIYLKHISSQITPEQFVSLVTKATADIGKITSPILMTKSVERDGETVEESLKFGFVNFETHEIAEKALERFSNEEKMQELVPELIAEGQTLYATPALPKAKRQQIFAQKPQNLNLYIKNIAESVSEDQLTDLFKKFGTITSLKIMRDDDTKTNKGFGFVCFDAPDAASAAIAEMNGFRLENKPLYVALAQPKAIRRQQLAQHYGRMGMPHQGMGMMGYAYYPPGMAPRFNARNPGFRGRPMPPGFTGGRGVPFIRGPPGQFAPNMMPGGPMPGPAGMLPQQGPPGDEYAEIFEMTPPENRTQALTDLLFKKILSEEKDEFASKRIVGIISTNVQAMNPQQRVEYLLSLCRNDSKRRQAVGQAKSPKQ